MQKKIQAKDIPTMPILLYLDARKGPDGVWCSCYDPAELDSAKGRSVYEVVPPGTPVKVVAAKMRSLIRRGLVHGCGCGSCRGDFVITDKGVEMIKDGGNQ